MDKERCIVKILNLQDNHINPRWIEESEEDIKRVCEIAKSEKVDAICIAGDFFDKQVSASDSSEWDRILQLARDLQETAQVFFIRGTPSHDAPGCYSSFIDIGWKEVGIGKSHTISDTLIMGMPEINSAFLHAKYPDLSKQEAIEKQYDLVNQIIDDYYVPLSRSHKGPVHFMMHGHVSGTKFRDDQKPRSTDFMFSEEMLSRIGADFIQAGHIHLEQDFKTVIGRYGGSMHITWNDVNFIPGFDVVEFWPDPNEDGIKKTRFDFGKLERQKIVIDDSVQKFDQVGSKIKDNVNLWLEIKCNKEFSDQFNVEESLEMLKSDYNLGPLSKITTTIQHEEHTRVDSEEYEAATTTEDIYKIYNPEVKKSILQKVKIAEESTASETASIINRTFEFLDMELIGSIINFENNIDRIFVDYSYFKLGANLFVGANGKGKSFINGLINPYSVHLPDETAIKKLFVLKNSSMVRRFRIVETDEIITQKILIDPTLAAPTAKFYMNLNGVNIAAENGNKDPFDSKVTEIFGSVKMFMACVFRAQKENPKMPSLENAKESDLRQIFTELSGIDRTPLKEFSHNKTVELKRSIDLDKKEIEILQSVEESAGDIQNAIMDRDHTKCNKEISLKKIREDLENNKNTLSDIESVVNENNNYETQISSLMSENSNLTADNSLLNFKLGDITKKLGNISQTRSELEELKKVQIDHTTASLAYFEAQGAYNKKVDSWQKEKDLEDVKLQKIAENAEAIKKSSSDLSARISENRYKITGLENKNIMINKPCEHCNKLSSSSELDISDNNKQIDFFKNLEKDDIELCESKESELQSLRDDYKIIQDSIFPKPPEQPKITELKDKMDSFKPDSVKISDLETIINNLKSSEDKKTEYEMSIKQKENRIVEAHGQIETLKLLIKPVDAAGYIDLKTNIRNMETHISSTSGEIGRLTAEIEALKKQLVKCNEREDKIKVIDSRLSVSQVDLTEWQEIEAAFSAKGIPALELSLIAPSINRKANEFLSMHSNRFNVDIITQDLDSKNNIAEKFKILIHDSHGYDVKNLPNCSPGQLSWLVKALQESISYIHSKRSGRNYLWSIMDEADGALDTEAMSDFYEMMDRAMDGQRKLISVSHSPIAKGLGLNTVNVEDFFMGGE